MPEIFDLVVFGGGTVGMAIALDASLRGLKVAVIERKRLGKQTNYSSLGLIQRDPKYLHTDVDLVWMNAVDCGLMKDIAGDFLKRQSLVIPVFPESKYPLWFWDSFIESLDSFAELSYSEKHELLSPKELAEEEPNILKNLGAVKYFEMAIDPVLWVRAIEKVIKKNGAEVFEFQEIFSFKEHIYNGKRVLNSVLIMDTIGGWKTWINGLYFINATGPWAPMFPRKFNAEVFRSRLTRGTSIIIKQKLSKNGIILFNKNGKYITVLPKDTGTIIGPTNYDISETVSENPDLLKPESFEIEELLDVVNDFFKCKVKQEDVVEVKCGLRPQLNHQGVKPDNITHDFAIIDHDARENIENFCSVFGGKISNQIRMAKESVDFALSVMSKKWRVKKFKRWQIPNVKILANGNVFLGSCGQDCAVSYSYIQKQALDFNHADGRCVGRMAAIKRIESLLFISPFMIKGFLKEIRRRFFHG